MAHGNRTRQEEAEEQLLAVVRKETCLRARERGGFTPVAQQNASNSFMAARRMQALLGADIAFCPAHSQAALRAGEPAARGPTLCFDSPAALRAAAASTMQAGAHARLLQQQLDAVSKGRQELRDQLDREQERSRELESANAQFNEGTNRLRNERNALQVQCNELESANAQFNECTNRLRNERNALQAQCNELKKERAPAVVPLGVNNGRVSGFFRR